MTYRTGALLALVVVLASGCASLKFPGVYRIPVQQGNIIDQKKIDQLQIGMTKRQVAFVMGTPLAQDPLHPDRWDYIYQVRRAGETLRDRRFTVVFENDVLSGFEGDFRPGGGADDEVYIEDAEAEAAVETPVEIQP